MDSVLTFSGESLKPLVFSNLINDSDSRVSSVSEMECAIIAATQIPTGVTTLPFVSSISLKRLLNPKPVNCVIRAYVSSLRVLCIDEHIDWIPLMRIARNCHEHNITAYSSHNDTAIILQTIRVIERDEEIKVWLSPELMIQMKVPFHLTPRHIINDHCYQCHKCGATFCQPNPLKVHLTFVCSHSDDTRICISQSPELSLAVPLEQRLIDTSQVNVPEMRVNKDNHQRTHTCLFCGKMYTRKYGLKIHVRTHTGQKPLQCRFCGRAFSDPSNLNKHVRLHYQNDSSSPSPYQCKLCGKVLVRRRDLQRHLKSRHQHN